MMSTREKREEARDKRFGYGEDCLFMTKNNDDEQPNGNRDLASWPA